MTKISLKILHAYEKNKLINIELIFIKIHPFQNNEHIVEQNELLIDLKNMINNKQLLIAY